MPKQGIILAAALPAICLAMLSAGWTIASLWGGGLWPPDEVTLAEAAATGNTAEVLRLIAAGDDPNGRTFARAVALSGRRDRWMTPLEAAVWRNDPGMVRLLLHEGAAADAHARRELRCLANAVHGQETRALLDRLWPEPNPTCEGFQLPR